MAPANRAKRGARFLVTGGAGFIGRHLTQRLVTQGDVVVVDSGVTGRLSEVPSEATLIGSDLADVSSEEWETALAGVDTVYHLAAAKHNTPGLTPSRLLDVNVAATWRLIQASGIANVRKFVFASSLYAYGLPDGSILEERSVARPDTIYGCSKLAGEGFLRTAFRLYGLRYAALRLFFAYGPGQYANGGYKSVIVSNFERMADGKRPTIYGDGTQALDYVFIDDVVDALVAAGEIGRAEVTVNVASGVPVSIEELTTTMRRIAGFDEAPKYLPPDWTARTVRFGSTALAREDLGWAAVTPLEEGLSRTWSSIVSGGRG